MTRILLIAALVATPALAADPPAPVTTPIVARTLTMSGQPIELPAGAVEVKVSQTELAAGSGLPEHRHPYQRYVYVVSGQIEVTNHDTGATTLFKPGDIIVEARGQWHSAKVVGAAPVRLMAMDQVPVGQANMERRTP